MHAALNHAIRDVRLREDFYRRGEEITGGTPINAEGKAKDTAWVIHRSGKYSLTTLFNFSEKTLTFTSPVFGKAAVPGNGVLFREF